MSLTRRSFLALLAATQASASAPSSSSLRLLFVRHSTTLVEMGAVRLLVDPSLSPSFGAPGVLAEVPGPPPPTPGSLGRVDIVAITCAEAGSFDADSVAHLDARRAHFLVPDDNVRKRLALLGHVRVRVVRAGDVVDINGLRISVSPGQGVVCRAIGFHVAARDDGPTFWHTGPVPPLEVDAQVMSFAADHPASLVCACASGVSLSSSGPPLLADVDDALALARLARARVLMPISRGVLPAGLFSLVLNAPPWSRPLTTSRDPHIEDPVPGTWYRFRA